MSKTPPQCKVVKIESQGLYRDKKHCKTAWSSEKISPRNPVCQAYRLAIGTAKH